MGSVSCIRHIPNTRVVVLREDFFLLCEEDQCSAMILSQFEFWMNVKLRHLGQAEFENMIAEKEGVDPTQNTELWVWKTQEQLRDEELFNLFGETKVSACLNYLVEQGYLLRRRNPRYRWDRTYQYMLNISKVQEDLDKIAQYRKTTDSIPYNYGFNPVNLRLQSRKNTETIPEITYIEDNNIEEDTDGKPPSVTPNETETNSETVKDDGVGKSKFSSPLKKPSKYRFKKESVDSIKKNLSENAQASKSVACRSKPQVEARQKQQPKNANTMIAHFNELFKQYFGGVPPVDLQKDRSLLKKMIKHYDYDYVQKMMDWLFRNWSEFRREKNITGVPTVGMFWGFRAYFQDRVPYQEDESEDAESF